MKLDTPQQAEYLIAFLDTKRDELHDRIKKMEDTFTDHVALHANTRYNELCEERELNALLTVKLMNDKIQLNRDAILINA